MSVEKFKLVFRRKGKIINEHRNFLSYNEAQRAYRVMDRMIPLDVTVDIATQESPKKKTKMRLGGVVKGQTNKKSNGMSSQNTRTVARKKPRGAGAALRGYGALLRG